MVKAQAVTYKEHSKDLSSILKNSEYETDESKLSQEEILIQLLATPINPSDIAQINGGYTQAKTFDFVDAHIGGNEGVYKIIKSNDLNFKVDDLVIPKLPGFGTWRTHAVVKSDDLIVVNGLELDQAATISINPSTAYQLINEIQDWKDGDWIIQNAGNSQVSQFVTQLAKLKGVRVLNIVRDSRLTDVENGIRESEFTNKEFDIKKYAKDGRVRLALNSVSNETVWNLVNSLSPDGVLITYGSIGGTEIKYDARVQLLKNIKTKAFWLTKNTKANPEGKVDTVKSLIKLYQEGKLKDVGYNKVKYAGDLRDSVLEAIQNSKNGKQVVFLQ
ncbi:unnamed protein product [Candida verbasci]|uniref:enoyl-[acyl-carrier-protein] reductase n=1 Tax=Candida verbasci TaxID=1227364 RepID=A0A9W4TVT4_9ASCO|nr:unnamed protein product [Candida verbasci]